MHTLVFAVLLALATFAQPVAAQPQLAVSPTEVPSGGTVTVTITGTPGLYWALVGSFRDNGLAYGGAALAVGTDVQILGSGFVGPSGVVTLSITPPLANGVDTYFLQAVSSASADFNPLTPSNGVALRPRGLYANSPTFPAGLDAGGSRIGHVGTPLSASDAASKAYVDQAISVANGSNPVFVAGLSAGGARVTDVATPTTASDAATKGYVDANAAILAPPATQSKSSGIALLNLEQTGTGDFLKLRVNASGVGGYGSNLNKDIFRFMADGGFVTSGILGIGFIPTTGSGERMMWHPYKAAFRAGSIGSGGTQWDDANVGFYTWAGGYNTTATGLSAFAMGYQSAATGSYANALGYLGTATGTGSIAIGYRAASCSSYGVAIGQRASTASAPTSVDMCGGTSHTGAMTFADASTTDHVGAAANNQFTVRAAGGYRLFTNSALTTGVTLSAGGSSWSVVSDRNAKYAFAPVDEQDVLRRLMHLPLSTFLYKDGDGRRYMGPMAQDFHAAFGLGDDDTKIAMNDIDGVALASLKALGTQVQQLRDANARLADDNAALQAALEALTTRLTALERRAQQ